MDTHGWQTVRLVIVAPALFVCLAVILFAQVFAEISDRLFDWVYD